MFKAQAPSVVELQLIKQKVYETSYLSYSPQKDKTSKFKHNNANAPPSYKDFISAIKAQTDAEIQSQALEVYQIIQEQRTQSAGD